MAQNEDFDHEFLDSNMEEGGEFKVAKIEGGNNFVVVVVVVVDELENGDPFFVIFCDHALHRCEATFQDEWGNTWYEGDMLLGGILYHCILG
jgi:hypothetical protein